MVQPGVVRSSTRSPKASRTRAAVSSVPRSRTTISAGACVCSRSERTVRSTKAARLKETTAVTRLWGTRGLAGSLGQLGDERQRGLELVDARLVLAEAGALELDHA